MHRMFWLVTLIRRSILNLEITKQRFARFLSIVYNTTSTMHSKFSKNIIHTRIVLTLDNGMIINEFNSINQISNLFLFQKIYSLQKKMSPSKSELLETAHKQWTSSTHGFNLSSYQSKQWLTALISILFSK